MEKKLYELTAKEIRDKFLLGEISAVEIINSFLERIEKGCFIRRWENITC